MSDPRIALRALQQIRGGVGSPLTLARRALLSRGLPQDYYDPEAEAADSLDEYDWGANPTPGDPFPDRAPDPGDEGRAAAIEAYQRNASGFGRMRGGGAPEFEFTKRPMAEDEFMDEGGPRALDSLPTEAAQRDAALRSGRWDVQQYEGANKGRPQNAAEALAGLGPIFAQLQGTSAYTGTPSVTTAPMGERYAAAGDAPQLGATPEELEAEKRRLLAGGY